MTNVLLAGDSTVAVCPADETPMSGWGAHLGAPLNRRIAALCASTVNVLNTAKGGATTASHRAEGLWDLLMASVKRNDVVIIQFGHNDQKYADLPAHGAFRENLERFVAEAREAGAWPVLCTPVARRHFVGDRVENSHGEYPDAVRAAAKAANVPLIDLTTWSTALYEELGPVESARLFTERDNTHFNFTGACVFAEYVAECVAPTVLEALE
ncbi:rhamnogalacturonan acetylesterase [Allorhizocola rhizosphaerae]|uniref:rhamnogalacturonan acetylesterase n=1 Tax=Allorhizocola rhizosphaerae TaxID=1872709 RepID=UPI000E3BFFD0|nr:rhamnogalacturonan acetylesterase [Allorhizocola rhizosphaerae]